MSRLTIGVDIDGVCADFLGACGVLAMKEDNVNIWPSIRSGKLSIEVDELLTKYQYTKELYRWMNPIPYAVDVLNHIVKEYGDIVYITARPLSTKGITSWWLQEHGFPEAKVINVRESKIPAVMREGVDIFLEDRLRYAMPLAESGVQVILLNLRAIDYRGKKLSSNIYLVHSWWEVDEIVSGLWGRWECADE